MAYVGQPSFDDTSFPLLAFSLVSTMRIAYVLGGADCIRDDLYNLLGDEQIPDGLSQRLRPLRANEGFVAVNEIGCDINDRLDAWVSYHGWHVWRNLLPRRQQNGYPYPKRFFGMAGCAPAKRFSIVEHMFQGQAHGGSSGLFAVKVALQDLKFDRAIVCGMPMTVSPHYFKSEDDHDKGGAFGWQEAQFMKRGWEESLPHLKGRVFSMSGWTKELLGSPPQELLKEIAHGERCKAQV